ncbi:MAG: indolepyruvate ferredoxin oxidoreductase subunit alpha [Alphaproteobacteria bacterium]|jgi:indolepyruvate ferredoxin oxidoreductase alpha subunit|nr:indolepyruvate ferredoxin oxidoreductase subunit alpha [Alphaproteobacteria bacterium]
MAEVSFKKDVEALKLGQGEVFHGEGIMAVTKALLQSGVSYVGGYQGAPVSHLLDVLVDAEEMMAELGVRVETCTNEAAAAAMLGASINYPVRGAVTWKSIVGTNVAADALSNLSSPGVKGGALIVVGEDYGEGASVIQERTHAFALKSSLWLLDPRPELPTIVRMVEQGFELSEASSTPVILELRIRACHVYGSFATKDNVRATWSARDRLAEPATFDYGRLAHPPVTFHQEADKVDRRLPAARRFIVERGLNERFGPATGRVGIIVQGGLFNVLNGRLALAGLSDDRGDLALPTLVLNVTHPLAPEQITAFCAGLDAVLIVEEGAPDYLEQAVGQILRHADLQTRLHGKDVLPMAGEYTPVVMARGVAAFLARYDIDHAGLADWLGRVDAQARALAGTGAPALPPRQPTFCTGCPERPVFSAMKILKREIGPVHVAADIGCHAFATFAPFSQGNTILGYGMSLASSAAVASVQQRRPVSIMGDGGFWHNGLLTGVAGAVLNRDDSVLMIMNNGYSSATGVQDLPSSAPNAEGRGRGVDIAAAVRALGAPWIRRVRTYGVAGVMATLKEALRSPEKGLKVIVADGECQLARQRRVRPAMAKAVADGLRVVRTRFWVDPDVCTGDHSCIRLSGCPSLTVKPSEDPLRRDPVAHVNNDCVGCGLCGEVSHAAQLCPSFAQIDVIQNPSRWDRIRHAAARAVMALL